MGPNSKISLLRLPLYSLRNDLSSKTHNLRTPAFLFTTGRGDDSGLTERIFLNGYKGLVEFSLPRQGRGISSCNVATRGANKAVIFGPLTWRLFSSTLSGLADYDSIAFEGRPHLFTARCPTTAARHAFLGPTAFRIFPQT